LDILKALNELEECIENSNKVPLTRKVMVDEDHVLDILDRIRTTIPEEIKQAKWIIQEREKVLNDSQKEAVRIIDDAQKQVDQKADESEIVRKARDSAEQIVQKAELISDEIRAGARQYADEILANLQDNLGDVLKQIEAGRYELKEMKKQSE